MASWIKLNYGLTTHPKVLDMAESLELSPYHVIGMLYHVWTWADLHSIDGFVDVSKAKIDLIIGVKNFANAMQKINWISEIDGKICFTNFSENNSASAKKRSSEAKRIAKNRSQSVKPERIKNVRKMYEKRTENVRKTGTESVPDKIRKDKIRKEELSPPLPPTFQEKKQRPEVVAGSLLPTIEKINGLNPRWPMRPLDSIELFTVASNVKAFESIDYELLKQYFDACPQYASKSRKSFINDCGSTACALADSWRVVAEKSTTKPLTQGQIEWSLKTHLQSLTVLTNNLANWHFIPNPNPGPGRPDKVKRLKPECLSEKIRLEKEIENLKAMQAKNAF